MIFPAHYFRNMSIAILAIAFLLSVLYTPASPRLPATGLRTARLRHFYHSLFNPDHDLSTFVSHYRAWCNINGRFVADFASETVDNVARHLSTPLNFVTQSILLPSSLWHQYQSYDSARDIAYDLANTSFRVLRDHYNPEPLTLYDHALSLADAVLDGLRWAVIHPQTILLSLAALHELSCLLFFRRRSVILTRAIFGWIFDTDYDPEPLPAGQSSLPGAFYQITLKSLLKDNADRTLSNSNCHAAFGSERMDNREDLPTIVSRLGFKLSEVFVIHAGNRPIPGLRFQYSYTAKCYNYKRANAQFCPYRLACHPGIKLIIIENGIYHLDINRLMQSMKTMISCSWNPTYVGQRTSELIVAAKDNLYDYTFAGGDHYSHAHYNLSQSEAVIHCYPSVSHNYEEYRSPLQRFADFFFHLPKHCITYRIDRQENVHTTFALFTPIRVSTTEFLPQCPIPHMRLTYTIPPFAPGNPSDKPYSFFALRVNSHPADPGERTLIADSSRTHGYFLGYPGAGSRVFIQENTIHAIRNDSISGSSAPAKLLQIFKENTSHSSYLLQQAAAAMQPEIDKHAYTSALKTIYSQTQLPGPTIRPIPPEINHIDANTINTWLVSIDGPYPEPIFGLDDEPTAHDDEQSPPPNRALTPILPPPPNRAPTPAPSDAKPATGYFFGLSEYFSDTSAKPVRRRPRFQPKGSGPTDDIITSLGLNLIVKNLTKQEKLERKLAQARYETYNHTQQHKHHAPLAPGQVPGDIVPACITIHHMLYYLPNTMYTQGPGPSYDAVFNRVAVAVAGKDRPTYTSIVKTVIKTACDIHDILHAAWIATGALPPVTRSVQELIDGGGQIGKRATEYQLEYNNGLEITDVKTSKAFTKKEGSRKEPADTKTRNISAAPSALVVGLSQTTDGLKHYLYDSFHGAAFQYGAEDIGTLVHDNANEYDTVIESDFSNFDGSQGPKTFHIETHVHILTSSDPAYTLQLKQCHVNLSYQTGPYVYRPAYTRQSGSADTSLSNTLINGTVHMLANVYSDLIEKYPSTWHTMQPTPERMTTEFLEECAQRCIIAGDDGMYYDTPIAAIEAVSFVLGLTAKLEMKDTDKPCTLLGRVYPCPKASGASGCDLRRFLQNICVAQIRSYLNPLEQLSLKVLSYSLTDRATPYISEILQRMQQTISWSYDGTPQMLPHLHHSDFPYNLRSGQGIPLGPVEQDIYKSLQDPDVVAACRAFFAAPDLDSAYAALPHIPEQVLTTFDERYKHLEMSRRKLIAGKISQVAQAHALSEEMLQAIPLEHWDQASSNATNTRIAQIMAKHDVQHLQDLTPASLTSVLHLSKSLRKTSIHSPHYELLPIYEHLLLGKGISVHPYPEPDGHPQDILSLAHDLLHAQPTSHVFIDLPFNLYSHMETPGHPPFTASIAHFLQNHDNVFLLVPTSGRDSLMKQIDRMHYTSHHIKGDAHLICPLVTGEDLYQPQPTRLKPIDLPNQPSSAEVALIDQALVNHAHSTIIANNTKTTSAAISIRCDPLPPPRDMSELLAVAQDQELVMTMVVPSTYRHTDIPKNILNSISRRLSQSTTPTRPGKDVELMAAAKTYILACAQGLLKLPAHNTPLHARLVDANKHLRINGQPHFILAPPTPSPHKL